MPNQSVYFFLMQEQVGKIENAHAVLQMRLKWIRKEKKEEKKETEQKGNLTSGLDGTVPWSVFISGLPPLSIDRIIVQY